MKSVIKAITATAFVSVMALNTASASMSNTSQVDVPQEVDSRVILLTDFEEGEAFLPGSYTDSDVSDSDAEVMPGFKQLRKLNSKHFI